MRWQNLVILEYGYYNINLLGRCLTANLPNRGKHRAQFQPESVIRPFNVILYKKNFLFLSKMVIFAANSGYIAKL